MAGAHDVSGLSLEGERASLLHAREAVRAKIDKLSGIAALPELGGADAVADEYIDAVVRGAIEKMRQELVTFGRIDDDHAWRIGLYGIDDGAGDQLVVDWRTPFAAAFYQANFDDPHGLQRRVSYVGCIDDLMVEDFASGEVSGSSPLMAELSRSRGETMKAAVATLQSEQDRLVRLPPRDRLVVRGGPGTGKTVVGLHRAAWLVYHDTRVTAERILVLGPSDRFLRFVATVLPTLGETRILQVTFDRLMGETTPAGHDERWVDVLDRLESSLPEPAPIQVGLTRLKVDEVSDLVERFATSPLPWRDRRNLFVGAVARRCEVSRAEASKATSKVFPAATVRQVWQRLRRRSVLDDLGAPPDLVDRWLAEEPEPAGALHDEIRARFEGVPAKYSHVIVDEAQDLSLLALRSVLRRADGVTMVGDDAQRSAEHGIGLERAARLAGAEVAVMDTAYRMSAEIADWLNAHAEANDIPAVHLDGIRPTGVPVRRVADARTALDELGERWPNVIAIGPGEVWDHKGVEYDGVVVETAEMSPEEIYLAASRAAHELVIA